MSSNGHTGLEPKQELPKAMGHPPLPCLFEAVVNVEPFTLRAVLFALSGDNFSFSRMCLPFSADGFQMPWVTGIRNEHQEERIDSPQNQSDCLLVTEVDYALGQPNRDDLVLKLWFEMFME